MATRVRYGRMTATAASGIVTLVALLGGMGLLPTAQVTHEQARLAADVVSAAGPRTPAPRQPAGTTQSPSSTTPVPTSAAAPTSGATAPTRHRGPAPVPAESGHGRRVVFSQSEQRVWLVRNNETVRRTYLVSGSVTDNLDPGTYEVYSRSRWAVGVEDSGVMQYFVRFTQGPTGAAIGFHSIPTKHGQPLQTKRQLGTPQSHGCIRQDLPDAIDLWRFAPVGTTVTVVA